MTQRLFARLDTELDPRPTAGGAGRERKRFAELRDFSPGLEGNFQQTAIPANFLPPQWKLEPGENATSREKLFSGEPYREPDLRGTTGSAVRLRNRIPFLPHGSNRPSIFNPRVSADFE